MDLYSKLIMGYDVSIKNDQETVLRTIKEALRNRKYGDKPIILHSDRGSTFTCKAVREHLRKKQITASFSRPGNPYDNASAERFFNTIKNEYKLFKPFKTFTELSLKVTHIILTYNCLRPHANCGYLTPNQMHNNQLLNQENKTVINLSTKKKVAKKKQL